METTIKNKVNSFLQEHPNLAALNKATVLVIIRPDLEAELDRCIQTVFDEYVIEKDCDDWDYDDDGEGESC